MTNPLHPNKSFEGAISLIGKLDYNTDVYANIRTKPQIFKTPKGIFVLEKPLLREIMRAILKFASKESQNHFLLRFALVEEL